MGGLALLAVSFENEHGLAVPHVRMGQTGRLYVLIEARKAVTQAAVGVRVHDRMDNLVFAAGNRQLGLALPPLAPGDRILVRMDIGFTLNPGPFTLTVDCGEPGTEGPNHGVFHDVAEGLGPVTVHYGASEMWPFYGIAQLPLALACERVQGPPESP